MAILWSLMVRFIVDHFSMPDMRLDGAVKPFMLREAMLIVALIGLGSGWFAGVFKSGFGSLGVGGYGCVPFWGGPSLRAAFSSLWPVGGARAVGSLYVVHWQLY